MSQALTYADACHPQTPAAMMRAALIVSACVLAACSSGPPKLKAGLWEIRGHSVENHGTKHTDFDFMLCRDQKYDAAQTVQAQHRSDCSTHRERTGPKKFASNSTCRLMGGTIASQGVTSYPNQSSVHSETKATYSPALAGKSDETIVQDQEFVGPCRSGMKAGDLIGADGLVRHQN